MNVNKLAARQLRALLKESGRKPPGVGKYEKSILAITASRYIKRAETMIAATAKGRFPK